MSTILAAFGLVLLVLGLALCTVPAISRPDFRETATPAAVLPTGGPPATVTSSPVPVTPVLPPSPTPAPTRTPAATATPTPAATRTPTRTPAVTPTSMTTPAVAIADAPRDQVRIHARWPKRMQVNRAEVLTVTMAVVPPDAPTPTPVVGEEQTLGTPGPVGEHRAAPLRTAFGDGYTVYAIATLDILTFDVRPEQVEYQSLDDPLVAWDWAVVPKRTGSYAFNVTVRVQWRATDGGPPIERVVWRTQGHIEVNPLYFTFETINVSGLLLTFIGSSITVPAVLKAISGWWKSRPKKGESKPEAPTPHGTPSPPGPSP